MDIVKIIDSSIENLPSGEYSLGLKAIRRHISAAIRHYERPDGGNLDSHTDSIYRCNQAFEGGLKEAYRVLAEKDPQKLSPFEIEKYLEENKTIRSRVLKQMTRYREDYRNPSTHDYKLDFDEDEALLAIVSVCAFTKLLINQISSKIAFSAGKLIDLGNEFEDDYSTDKIDAISKIIIAAIKKMPENVSDDFLDISFFIDGALTGNGQITEPSSEDMYEEDELEWSNKVIFDDGFIPVETRNIPHCDLNLSLSWIMKKMITEDVEKSIFVIVANDSINNLQIRDYNFSNNKIIKLIMPSVIPSSLSEYESKLFDHLLKQSKLNE